MSEVAVGTIDEIPVGEARTFVVNGEQVAVFRLRDGSLRAIGAVCPHLGGPLADGLADEQVVVCPLHSYTFDLSTGAEVSGAIDGGVTAYEVGADETGVVCVKGSRATPD